MDYIEAIRKRESIRSYKDKSIKPKDKQKIKKIINNNCKGPFGNAIDFKLLTFKNKNEKIGTYGIIKDAQSFIAGITVNNNEKMVDFGYVFEDLILQLTMLNIGTCWLGGTFKRKDFINRINLKDNEIIPCITPIGYPKNKKRFIDKIMRTFAGSDNRKAWSELFFYKNFKNGINKKNLRQLKTPLEMLRLAPSASNKQPWRILVSEDYKKVHFFIKRDKKYRNSSEYDIQLIDLGISMAHFEKVCKQEKLNGYWGKNDEMDKDNKFNYVLTFLFD